MMSDIVIETKQVSKTYASLQALDHVTIRVPKGSIYGLIGDNGAGKSTLLKLLAGHSFATKGEIQLFGQHDEKALDKLRRQMGFMVENTAFFPNMTVEQILKYYCIQKGLLNLHRVEEIMTTLNLLEKKKSKCKTLSLGQKQRLGLGIALLNEPEVLVLDEPINGLDPSGIVEFRNLLQKLNEEKNITILLSSHILSELEQLATIYGFLNQGRLVEEITADKLRDKCSNCLEIEVSDIQNYAILLKKTFPEDTYELLPNGKIRIYNPKESTEAYSRLASENQLYITGMAQLQNSLEDYYINLKKGKRGA